ncbi:MAG: Cytoplasmic protein [Promethearchaeota archaeon]|nr:MAG: Cytoplasmic protein [Candidatus Lokiarchaeota archaeon]
MTEFIRPKVVSSKCIEFEYCRYNGNIIRSDIVRELKEYLDFTPVCPEVEVGLGVPRDPIRIVEQDETLKLIQSSTGKDITEDMISFARDFLGSLPEVDGFILKYKSPSCGTKHTPYLASTQKGAPKVGTGPGLFGREVLNMFPRRPVENEGRLRNFRIREHFLTQLYTIARFRKVKESESMHELVQFQAHNKFLLMAYNQEMMREMGRIVANPDKKSFSEVINDYENHLLDTLAYPPKYTSNINVLMHMLGYFSEDLSHEEKAFFLDELEKYRAGWVPLFVMTRLLKTWVVRFDQPYLKEQTFFEIFPEELMIFDLKDTWRGRSHWEKRR